ncbi:FAD-dependent monooxygenase [Methylobacterium sp. WSM2598]|uniref:FAD-dependent monooxygenase n=1 Tax=Methylobacterium sp. WSM2598 TaxID=398261 RepID=UPI0003604928|nr:FAD-dependent monooxygenase [Methylobacterium sp. WSM2598]
MRDLRVDLDSDVLIVGAGPVGLALAIGLRLHGLSVRVVDRARGPKNEPRAAVIWPRGAEVLDDLGLGAAVSEAANTLRTVHFYGQGRRLGAAQLGSVASAYPTPLLIEQHVTERLLEGRLRALGAEVAWGCEARDLSPDPCGVTTMLADCAGRARAWRSAWLVGCDGSRSLVRDRLGIAFEGHRVPDLQILQVNAVPRWRHPANAREGYYFLAPGACLGCFPVAEGSCRFFCYATDPDPDAHAPPSLAEAEALIARVAGTPEIRLERATWFNRARFQTRLAARMRRGRVLLAGDAAHVWSSLGGHGMSLGLRGAHNLAWKLAAVHGKRAPDLLLDSYEDEQRASVRRFLSLMRYNLVETPSSRPGLLLREGALWAALAHSAPIRWVERAVSDVDDHHRDGPLAGGATAPARAPRGLRPGDRLPDAGEDDTPDRLHGCLDYRSWTLLLPLDASAAEHAAIRSLLAPWSDTIRIRVAPASARMILPRASLVLVRPDRHVALIAQRRDLARLHRYAARWLVGPSPSGPTAPAAADASADDGSLCRDSPHL